MVSSEQRMMTSRDASDRRSKAVDNGSVSGTSATKAPAPQRPHVAAAAAIDALLASEARDNLNRARTNIRSEPVKAAPRTSIPPARIVARQPQSPSWKTPFFSLALVVGLSTLISAGSTAYILLRPQVTGTVSASEIRSLRDSVTQLRRQVADLTTQRATADVIQASKSDRAMSPPPSREASGEIVKTNRFADHPSQIVSLAPLVSASATTNPAPEYTGSVPQLPAQQASISREPIADWFVRRAYDGVAIIEGKPGVIEVVLGQDIPGVGRVQEIKNENNRWHVLTSKGVISSR